MRWSLFRDVSAFLVGGAIGVALGGLAIETGEYFAAGISDPNIETSYCRPRPPVVKYPECPPGQYWAGPIQADTGVSITDQLARNDGILDIPADPNDESLNIGSTEMRWMKPCDRCQGNLVSEEWCKDAARECQATIVGRAGDPNAPLLLKMGQFPQLKMDQIQVYGDVREVHLSLPCDAELTIEQRDGKTVIVIRSKE